MNPFETRRCAAEVDFAHILLALLFSYSSFKLPLFKLCSKTTICAADGSQIVEGVLVINPKSTRLSLNQAKALFDSAAGKFTMTKSGAN